MGIGGNGRLSVKKQAAIFLDRDGVIVDAIVREGKPYPPQSLPEMRIATDARAALAELKAAGFLLIVVSNQPDVARGIQDRREIERMNAALHTELPIDDILTCYHDDADGCSCRKPRPGLLSEACTRFAIDREASFLVGDRWRDIEAGQAFGCSTIWIKRGYAERGPAQPPTAQVQSLGEAASWISRRARFSPYGNKMHRLPQLKTKLFADGAERKTMLELYRHPLIAGFTTNPTLIRKAGVTDYEQFARDIIEAIPDRPISFEVFADDCDEMERQARYIATWGDNVYVKVPVTNTRRESCCSIVRSLTRDGIKVNVTALLSFEQVCVVSAALEGGAPAYISVFAGRVADTGRDPLTVMQPAMSLLRFLPNVKLIWASPRELLNVFQANSIGCHIITATGDILKKLELVGKDLEEYSLETVAMFRDDALKANFTVDCDRVFAGAGPRH
jgi:transaldolase